MELIEFIKNKGFYWDNIKEGNTQFSIHPKQKEILESLRDNRFNLILKKTRQSGLSTMFIWYIVWQTIQWMDEKEKRTISLIGPKLMNSKHMLNSIKKILITLGYKDNFTVNNIGELRIDDKITIKTFSTHVSSFCGYSPDLIVFDEAAFIPNFEDLYNNGIPSLATGGRVLIGSSPNCINYFHNVWTQPNNYNKITLHWTDLPYRNIEWYEDMKKHIGSDQISQELDGDFINPKKFKDKTVSLRISEELYDKIGNRLIETDKSISNYLRELIESDL